MCWKYKLLKPFYKPNKIPICCVGCKWARKNKCHYRYRKNRPLGKPIIYRIRQCGNFISYCDGICSQCLLIIENSTTDTSTQQKERD